MKRSQFGVSFSRPQRLAIADLLPQYGRRLRLEAKGQQKIALTVPELQSILRCAGEGVVTADSGVKRNSLRRVIAACQKAIRDAHGINAIAPSKRLYQFKITLVEIVPRIWRRIQIRDGSLDKLHEHIQTAMGWTNSHLHQFEIQGMIHGDPELVCDNPDCFVGVNSRETKVSQIVPRSGARFQFSYEYDFGDGWVHEVLFEGCLERTKGVRYPLCLEGERACPPEDVGGVTGYAEFLSAIADPEHEEHLSWKEWAGWDFDPEHFDPERATRRMQRGLPDWRSFADTSCQS